jgi:hypothetical protein
MKKAHFVMQGKGGIGKSYIACLIAQRYLRNGGAADVECVDTDPVNKTLCSYASLKAMRLELLEKGAVKERNFDMLMERILREDKHFVVDNGATSFLPISRYLSLTNSLELIAQTGKKVVVHSVVVGGQELLDTLHGLDTLASSLAPSADLVVWLNEHNSPVVSEDGKCFEEMKVFETHRARIAALVRLPEPPSEMFREDLRAMTSRRLTFAEAAEHAEFPIMSKQRLAQTARAIFSQLEQVI